LYTNHIRQIAVALSIVNKTTDHWTNCINNKWKMGLTRFSKVNGAQNEDRHLTDFGKNINNANSAKKNPEYEKISLMDNNKLYNCKENNHPKRARSVVRISRRSSEPQTVGSKPIGPVYFFSNTSR
jgi:hypothetical protein